MNDDDQTVDEALDAVFVKIDAAFRAAFEALRDTRACRESHRREDAEAAVNAAAPVIRAEIAAAIHARAEAEAELHQCSTAELPDSSRYFLLGLLCAARIARGEQA